MDFPRTDDPLVAALQRLIARVGSVQTVAKACEINDQSLYQIAYLKPHSRTGKVKSVGPSIRKRLTNAYPDWMQPQPAPNDEPYRERARAIVNLPIKRKPDASAVLIDLRALLQEIPDSERHGMAGLWASFCNSAGADHHMSAILALMTPWLSSKEESTDSRVAGA